MEKIIAAFRAERSGSNMILFFDNNMVVSFSHIHLDVPTVVLVRSVIAVEAGSGDLSAIP